ncbi:MAG: hypothetical protein LBH92_00945 [Bacteroidales bacterium]|jgi:hypothetical protein|nr:hypothetical protein [Bacteroidales bacterium]
MRRATYYFIAIVLFLGIVGCEDDPNPPQIRINDGEKVVVDKISVDSLALPIYISSESYLYSIKVAGIYKNGSEYIMRNILFEGLISEYEDTLRYSDFPSDFLQYKDLMVSAITSEGIKQTRTVPITFSNFGKILADPESFEWRRLGINDGQGLDEFGLMWDNNIIEEFAEIKKKSETLKFCQLDPSFWELIKTEEYLREVVDAASSINVYTNVSTVENLTYNDVLGIKLNSTTYYLLHITYAKVEHQEGYGKVVVISGEYKKVIQ